MLAVSDDTRYQTGAVSAFAFGVKSPMVVLSSEVCQFTTHLVHHSRNVYASRRPNPWRHTCKVEMYLGALLSSQSGFR